MSSGEGQEMGRGSLVLGPRPPRDAPAPLPDPRPHREGPAGGASGVPTRTAHPNPAACGREAVLTGSHMMSRHPRALELSPVAGKMKQCFEKALGPYLHEKSRPPRKASLSVKYYTF